MTAQSVNPWSPPSPTRQMSVFILQANFLNSSQESSTDWLLVPSLMVWTTAFLTENDQRRDFQNVLVDTWALKGGSWCLLMLVFWDNIIGDTGDTTERSAVINGQFKQSMSYSNIHICDHSDLPHLWGFYGSNSLGHAGCTHQSRGQVVVFVPPADLL